MNKENVKYLNEEQMEAIHDKFREIYPDHDQVIYLHEKESEYVHSDLGFMWSSGDKDLIIIYTMGMSASKNSNIELFIKVPKNMMLKELSCSICDNKSSNIIDCIDPKYLFLIKDMIKLTKLPEMTGEVYSDGHTIMMDRDNPYYYGFREVFNGDIYDKSISFCYLVPLTVENFIEISSINPKKNWEKRLSYLDSQMVVYNLN